MTSTEASTTASTAGTASSSSAPDTLSASLLLALPALPPTPSSASASSSACASVAFHLNQHAAPVFFPTALNVAPLLEPTLSAAPHLLPYTSQQSTVYFPTASPPPNAAPLDGGGCDWRTAPSGLYYPNHHAAAMQRQGLRVSWDTRSFDYSNTSVDSSALGMPRSSATALAATSGSLPSLPYSGYPAFEHHPGSRQLSGGGGGGGRQMSAGRRRWDSGSRWRSNAHSTPRQNTQQFYPQQHPQRQHHQQQPQEPRHIPLAAAADAANNSNIPFKEDRVTAQHDPATASPALSGVERLFDPQSVKAQYRGLQRPGAIDTAIDDRRDRKLHRVAMFTLPIACVLPLELRKDAHVYINGEYPYYSPYQLQANHSQNTYQPQQTHTTHPTRLWQQQQQQQQQRQAIQQHYPSSATIVQLPAEPANNTPSMDVKVPGSISSFRPLTTPASAATPPIA